MVYPDSAARMFWNSPFIQLTTRPKALVKDCFYENMEELNKPHLLGFLEPKPFVRQERVCINSIKCFRVALTIGE